MITKPNQMSFNDKKLAVIIGGVAGIGKTTLALSSPKPLLIDLDKGVSRVEARYRTDTAFINTYDELINDLKNSDLSDYETLVIDTGGKLLELLKPVVIKEDSKNGKRDGNLSLQGYGAVKRKFSEFVSFVKTLNKHLVFVFHATEVNLPNDLVGLRIRMEGSSKDEVWDDIDVGGFIEMKGKTRTIGFSNCERYYAKGTHGIHGEYEIPTLQKGAKNTFLTDLFNKIKNNLNEEVVELNKYNEVMNLMIPVIDNANDITSINQAYSQLTSVSHYLTSKDELWFRLNSKAKNLGLKYDRATNQFI